MCYIYIYFLNIIIKKIKTKINRNGPNSLIRRKIVYTVWLVLVVLNIHEIESVCFGFQFQIESIHEIGLV